MEPVGANLSLVVVTATLIALSGCQSKPPVPQEALDQLKAYVENDGREVPTQDIFSMPPGISTPPTPGPAIKVTSMRYNSSAPQTGQGGAEVPAGTLLHTYEVWDTRTDVNGSSDREQKWFYVYTDTSGQWRFLKRDNPYR